MRRCELPFWRWDWNLAESVVDIGSVWLTAHIARRIWPEDAWAPVMAGIFLAISPQVLITGMTAYSMPAHLFLNLLWLALYLARRSTRPRPGAVDRHRVDEPASAEHPRDLRGPVSRAHGARAAVGPRGVFCPGVLAWLRIRHILDEVESQLPVAGQAGDDLGPLKTILTIFTQVGFRSWFNTGVLLPQIFTWQSWVVGFFALAVLRQFRVLCPSHSLISSAAWFFASSFYFLYGYRPGTRLGKPDVLPLPRGILSACGGRLEIPRQSPGRRTIWSLRSRLTLFVEFPYRCCEVYA